MEKYSLEQLLEKSVEDSLMSGIISNSIFYLSELAKLHNTQVSEDFIREKYLTSERDFLYPKPETGLGKPEDKPENLPELTDENRRLLERFFAERFVEKTELLYQFSGITPEFSEEAKNKLKDILGEENKHVQIFNRIIEGKRTRKKINLTDYINRYTQKVSDMDLINPGIKQLYDRALTERDMRLLHSLYLKTGIKPELSEREVEELYEDIVINKNAVFDPRSFCSGGLTIRDYLRPVIVLYKITGIKPSKKVVERLFEYDLGLK